MKMKLWRQVMNDSTTKKKKKNWESIQYNSGTQIFELLENGISFVLSETLLQDARNLLDQILRFLKPQIGESPNFLYDLYLRCGVVFLQLYIEHRLLLRRGSRTSIRPRTTST
ncbi:hypothetical protein S245_008512 [Arachis hypogaea]